MLLQIQLDLILSCFSEAGLLIIIILYSSFHSYFLKHPNQVYFYSLIFQSLAFALEISLDIMVLMYFLFRNHNNIPILIFLFHIQTYFSILGFHYIIALNIEIIIKISRASVQSYKKRVLIYHIFSIVMTTIFILLIFSLQDFNFNVYKDLKDELTYNLLLWYVMFLSVVSWACVGIYCKYMVKLKSTSLFNLVLLTVLSNISIILDPVIPQILYYCKVSFQNSVINWVILIVSTSQGTLEFIVLILNKKSIRLIKNYIQKYRNKQKRISRSLHNSRECSTTSVLLEINERRKSLSDGGLLCYFFDQVTKEVIYR